MDRPAPLSVDFYQREDTLLIAQQLLGCHLYTQLPGEPRTGGMIIETEAYCGLEDRASHAYRGRRTARTETLFGEPGRAYVYFCYGIHHLFNVVTHSVGVPHGVLIRALLPSWGLATISQRRGAKVSSAKLACGPGALCQALGITKEHNGLRLDDYPIWIEQGQLPPAAQVRASPRIGVDYAGEDAALPWRFCLTLGS